MPEEISNPLLSLIKDQGLIDDLQYEEVRRRVQAQRHARRPDPAGLRHHEAGRHPAGRWPTTWAPRWSRCSDREFTAGTAARPIPAKIARMYHCLPVGAAQRHAAGRAGRPARPGRMRTNSVSPSRRDMQLVVADPAADRKGDRAAFTARTKPRAFRKSSRNWARTRTSPAKSTKPATTDDAA